MSEEPTIKERMGEGLIAAAILGLWLGSVTMHFRHKYRDTIKKPTKTVSASALDADEDTEE